MKLSLSIDRFEGDSKEVAVLVTPDGAQATVPRALLPKGSKAGDALTVTIERDAPTTRKVAARTKKVQDDLKRGDGGGDIKL